MALFGAQKAGQKTPPTLIWLDLALVGFMQLKTPVTAVTRALAAAHHHMAVQMLPHKSEPG